MKKVVFTIVHEKAGSRNCIGSSGDQAIGESKGKKNRFHYSPCSCSDEPKRNSVRSLMTRWPDHPMTRCVLISMVEAKTAS